MDLYDELREKRILLIEDDPWTHDALSLYFGLKGCALRAVGTVSDALEAIGREHFDVIICDYWMPDMDGLTLLDLVEKSDPEAIRILITGYPTSEIVAEADRLGVHELITKPVTVEALEETLERLLARRKEAGAASAGEITQLDRAAARRKGRLGRRSGRNGEREAADAEPAEAFPEQVREGGNRQ